MCTCSLFHCAALFPFRFSLSGSEQTGLIAVLQALHERSNKKVFFYANDQIAHFVRDHWSVLTTETRDLLVQLAKDQSHLPETSSRHLHITEDHELEILHVLRLGLLPYDMPDLPADAVDAFNEAA